MSLDQFWQDTLNEQSVMPSSSELLKKIIADWKLDWNDLESYKALLESQQTDKTKLLWENQDEQKKLFMDIVKEMLTINWFKVNNQRDKEVLKMLLWTFYSVEILWIQDWKRVIETKQMFDKVADKEQKTSYPEE